MNEVIEAIQAALEADDRDLLKEIAEEEFGLDYSNSRKHTDTIAEELIAAAISLTIGSSNEQKNDIIH